MIAAARRGRVVVRHGHVDVAPAFSFGVQREGQRPVIVTMAVGRGVVVGRGDAAPAKRGRLHARRAIVMERKAVHPSGNERRSHLHDQEEHRDEFDEQAVHAETSEVSSETVYRLMGIRSENGRQDAVPWKEQRQTLENQHVHRPTSRTVRS